MHALWPELGNFVSWLITSGALAGALRSLWTAVQKKRAGVAVRDSRRRLDLAAQVRVLTANVHALREYCIAHGTAPSDLPPLPDFLKEPA